MPLVKFGSIWPRVSEGRMMKMDGQPTTEADDISSSLVVMLDDGFETNAL